MDKRQQLRKLAEACRSDQALSQHRRIGDFFDDASDWRERVSPWTASAGNENARVMILLQDWSSTEALGKLGLDAETRRLGYTPGLATNKTLIALVKRHFGLAIADTYVTNLFVFIKNGPMSARIPFRDAVYCAKEYAIPQIEIVQPQLALCVGLLTYNAVRAASGEKRLNAAQAWATSFCMGSIHVHAVPHTGFWGARNAGGVEQMNEIWSRIASAH